MKLALSILGIFFLLGQTLCDDKLNAAIQKCLKETGLPEEKISGAQDRNDPVMKCFMACMAEEMGVMKDGKIVEPAFLEEIKNFYPNADSYEKEIKDCIAKGNAQTEKCEVVVTAKNCVVDFAGEHAGIKT